MADNSIFRSGSGASPPSTGGQLGQSAETDAGGSIFRSNSAASHKHLREAELVAAINDLPALSAVVTSILTKVDDELSSAADLEELVKQDMVIAGRLIKLVNSPFFGLQYPVSSISQAVAIIGMNSLKSLVVAASTSALLMSDLSAYGFKENGLWDNSMATAAVSRHIATLAGVEKEEAETYFLAGLLRDIGMLVLGPFFAQSEQNGQAAQPFTHGEIKGESDILYREREILGFDHCWVGARISEKWHLPDVLHQAITSHHQQFHDLDEGHKKIVSIIRLAECLVYKAGVGVLPDHPFDRGIDSKLLSYTGLSAESFKELITDISEIIDAVKMDF